MTLNLVSCIPEKAGINGPEIFIRDEEEKA